MPVRGRPVDDEPESRSLLLRLALWGGAGIVGLIAVAAVALMVWSPVGLVRDQLIARVRAQTGRDLVIAGPASLSFFPKLSVSMSDVSLSAPAGMSGGPTLKMQALEVSVPLVPLLQRRVNVERLLLRRPVIDLHIDARGQRSWDFAALPPQLRVRYAQAGGTRPSAGGLPKELQDFVRTANPDSREALTSRGPLAALEALSLEDVQIEGGTVRFADDRSGYATEARDLNAQLRLANVASPLDAKGNLVWQNEAIAFEARLASPRLLSEDRAARLALKVSGRPFEFDFDGTVLAGRTPEAEGNITLKSPSVAALLALTGFRPGGTLGLTTAGIAGRLKAGDGAITLSDGTANFDDVSAQGTLTIEPRSPRPMLRGNVQISALDLNRLSLPRAIQPLPAVPAPLRPASAAKAAPAAPAQSIEELLRQSQPAPGARVQGYTKRHGWSDEPIDVAAFGFADADLKVSLGQLVYRDIKVGQTSLRLAVKDRALTANFDDIVLYDGRGRGLLTIDGAAAMPAVGANFSLDGTSALPLLKDAADFDWVAGKARVNIALGGIGATERQVVASLNGKVDVQFHDGAVVGYNIQNVLAGISHGKFSGLERSANAKTDFSEMAASFTIQNGVAVNRDLRLISPSLRITGSGSANLPERTMDYLLRPKLVAAPAGSGDPGGLEVPVKLTGSWDRPTLAADLDAVLKNPEQAVDTAKKLGEQFKKANPEAVNKAKDLLNKLLRR